MKMYFLWLIDTRSETELFLVAWYFSHFRLSLTHKIVGLKSLSLLRSFFLYFDWS